jgi:hypothetical protein
MSWTWSLAVSTSIRAHGDPCGLESARGKGVVNMEQSRFSMPEVVGRSYFFAVFFRRRCGGPKKIPLLQQRRLPYDSCLSGVVKIALRLRSPQIMVGCSSLNRPSCLLKASNTCPM